LEIEVSNILYNPGKNSIFNISRIIENVGDFNFQYFQDSGNNGDSVVQIFIFTSYYFIFSSYLCHRFGPKSNSRALNTNDRSEGFPNGIFHPCTLWARGLARWKNCRRVAAVVGVIWKFRSKFRPGNYILSFTNGFGVVVRDI
jgi:hypothetical protein